jgi:hypothetical protein
MAAIRIVQKIVVSMTGNQDFHTELKEALRSGTGLVIPDEDSLHRGA